MTLQIISDLHLESPKSYDIFDIVPKSPYLALLGDIGNVVSHKDEFFSFLTQQLNQFRVVLFVPGNHEAYYSSWPETLDALRAFERDTLEKPSLGKFVLLDRTTHQLPGTNAVILGCSLFSHVPAESHDHVSFGLNDFYHIKDWDVEAHNQAHARDLAWLNAQVAELEKKPEVEIVILTHWSPSRDGRTGDPRHMGSPITSGFSTNLSSELCFTSDRVKVWAFGHTHFNCDIMIERDEARPLRLLANQRGYYHSQAQGSDLEKTIDI